MVTHKTTQSYYACLSRTVLLVASEGNCRQKARAQLDPGAMLSLVTSRQVHSVHAKIIKNSSVNISGPDYSSNCRLDLLLGMVHCCNLCSQGGTVFSKDNACKAEKIIFGWAIGGSPPFSSFTPTSASTYQKLVPVQENTGFLLQRIWAMEEHPGDSNNLTKHKQLAITPFKDTHARDADVRYVASLPRKEPYVEIGRSRKTAFQHFLITERSLKKRQVGLLPSRSH